MSAFDRLLGQPFAKRVLSSALLAGRPASAYLFFGPPGSGKKTAALALAQALFCADAPLVGCGECSACRRVAGHKHPDFFVLSPQGASFKVEQVRDLLREVSLKPFEAARRVMVLDKVEQLSPEAANALLKALEEPSDSMLYVLVTTARAKIMPTIASRCQALRFGPLPEKVLVQILQSQKGLPEAEARSLAGLAGGSVRFAERLSGEAGREIRELAEAFLEAVASHSMTLAINWAHLAGAEKKRLDELCELIGAYLRELWVEKAGLPAALKIFSTLPTHGGGLSPQRLEALLLGVARAQGQLQRNANVALVLENMVLAGEV